MHEINRAVGLLLALAFLMTIAGRVSVRATAPDPTAVMSEGLFSCAEIVDLSACRLSTEELGRRYTELLQGCPELFHVALRLSYRSCEDTEDGIAYRRVLEIYPSYTLTGEALTAARVLYRDTITGLLAEMDTAFEADLPTEAERVLYIHDLLANRYAYDTRETEKNADAYTFFRDGVGICQAYALAFIALARGAGLEADFVASSAMDHAWNHVRVDGTWYHVDVTRDDPIPASDGREEVNHSRLLRSDEGMAALGYHGYTCAQGHTCGDARFEQDGEADLGGFHEALVPLGDSWLGESAGGAPVAITVGGEEKGFSAGREGDVDRDEKNTPADLLALYDERCPETWREWVRKELVK